MNLPDALCARVVTPGYDPFYSTDGETPTERGVRENEAVAICLMCPALAACARLAKADPDLRRYSVIAAMKPPAPRRTLPTPTVITPELRAKVRADYAAGTPVSTIARTHGIGASTVSQNCADLRAVRQATQESA